MRPIRWQLALQNRPPGGRRGRRSHRGV